jgi:hypothetical protein
MGLMDLKEGLGPTPKASFGLNGCAMKQGYRMLELQPLDTIPAPMF